MSEKTQFIEQNPYEVMVNPKTLYTKPAKLWDTTRDLPINVTVVLGREDFIDVTTKTVVHNDVFTAQFFDEDEAKAFVVASCHFGRDVKGYRYGSGVEDREQPNSGT